METTVKDEKLDFDKVWKMFQETDKRMKATDKQLKELGKQIGGLGNKFGSYTEGLFFPSLKSILEKKFKVTNIIRNLTSQKGNENIEVDVLGYSNGPVNIAYIVEIKSHLQLKHIEQTISIIGRFKTFFPEHKDKKLYGIIASINFTSDLKQLVLEKGLYFAQIHDDTFKLVIPKNFKPFEF